MGDNHTANPIGVFDSGVGGLSVMREIRRELPGENLLYVADSAHAPYGEKSSEFIEDRSIAIIEFLIGRQAKAIVVACNTATGAAVASLRSKFSIPIVAMEPAVKPAVANTQSGVVGVLATSRTLSSHNFVKLFNRFGAQVEILMQACPGLVEQVEVGDLTGDKTRKLLEQYLFSLLHRGADTIVLGCTHYPFLIALIKDIAGPGVRVIDPSAAVARELRRRLSDSNLLSNLTDAGFDQFWTSHKPEKVQSVISQLWEANVEVFELPSALKK
jgi:glutamate racemase